LRLATRIGNQLWQKSEPLRSLPCCQTAVLAQCSADSQELPKFGVVRKQAMPQATYRLRSKILPPPLALLQICPPTHSASAGDLVNQLCLKVNHKLWSQSKFKGYNFNSCGPENFGALDNHPEFAQNCGTQADFWRWFSGGPQNTRIVTGLWPRVGSGSKVRQPSSLAARQPKFGQVLARTMGS